MIFSVSDYLDDIDEGGSQGSVIVRTNHVGKEPISCFSRLNLKGRASGSGLLRYTYDKKRTESVKVPPIDA
jgi:hypothetical protein